MRVALGILLVVALAGVAITVPMHLEALAERRAYDEAPVCRAGEDRSCRRVVPATVAVLGERRVQTQKQTLYHLGLALADRPGRPTEVPVSEELYRSVQDGEAVEVEIWQGAITSLQVRGRRVATHALPPGGSYLFAFPVAIAVALAIWSLVLWRRRR